MRPASVVAFIVAIMALQGAVNTAEQHVAIMETFTSPTSSYKIYPQGVQYNVAEVYYSRPVFEGDEIEIRGAGSLTLSFTEGGSRVITAKDSPYIVTRKDANSTKPDGVISLVRAVAHMLAPWSKEAAKGPPIGMRVRGDVGPLDVAVLDHDRLQMVEGRRDFTLSWTGGKPPFNIRMWQPGSPQVALEATPLTERVLASRPLTLSKGACRLRIEDALGQSFESEIMVVNRLALPQPPASPDLAALPSGDQEAVHAAWLASIDDGVWALESYLLASKAASKSEPARALAAMLAAGDLPVLP